jgi:very-short-patch-repair endonuclease
MPAATNRKLRATAKETCRSLRKTETPAERTLWSVLRDRRFHGLKFYRQYPLFVDWMENETFFVADFYCFERNVVVEVDGKIHDYRSDHDQLRTFILNDLGITVVRVRNEEIEQRLYDFIDRLRKLVGVYPSPTP